MSTTTKAPDFFQHIDAFIEAIPKQSKPQQTTSKEATTASPNHPLILNYLDHYSMNLVAEKIAAEHEIWQSSIKDYRIVEQRWQPTATNGKTLILAHGYFDHTALYGKIIRWALKRGYVIHSFDLPGHGLSSGQPAAIDSFDTYSEVLTTIIKRENYSDYILIGQSTGCAVILNTLLNKQFNTRYSSRPERIVLLAPLVRSLYWQRLRWPYLLLRTSLKSIKRKFINSSHDDVFNQFLKKRDPLQARVIPLSWLGAMDKWIKKITQLSPIPDYPCAIIQGTEDATVDYHYNHEQIQRCLPNTSVYFIEGAWHHLVNENEMYWGKIRNALDNSF